MDSSTTLALNLAPVGRSLVINLLNTSAVSPFLSINCTVLSCSLITNICFIPKYEWSIRVAYRLLSSPPMHVSTM